MTDRDRLILEMMPATCADLAEVLGFTQATTLRILWRLKEDRLCFILRWDGLKAVYVAGRGRDARRSKSKREDPKVTQARFRERRKAALIMGPFAALFQIKP